MKYHLRYLFCILVVSLVLITSAQYSYSMQPNEIETLSSIDFNKDLNPLQGSGLEDLDFNYKIEAHYDEEEDKYIPYIIFRESKGECDDIQSPTGIAFRSWGVFPLTLDVLPGRERGQFFLFKKEMDQIIPVGTTSGFLTYFQVPKLYLQAHLNHSILTLQLFNDTTPRRHQPIWMQEFNLFRTPVPLKGLRNSGDRTFCKEILL